MSRLAIFAAVGRLRSVRLAKLARQGCWCRATEACDPLSDRSFALTEIAETQYLEADKHVGKVVIRV